MLLKRRMLGRTESHMNYFAKRSDEHPVSPVELHDLTPWKKVEIGTPATYLGEWQS
jgi:hypothetical protein